MSKPDKREPVTRAAESRPVLEVALRAIKEANPFSADGRSMRDRMERVIMAQRAKGLERYGDDLHTLNGRLPLGGDPGCADHALERVKAGVGDMDEELADLVMYATQAIMQSRHPAKTAMEILDRIDYARSIVLKALRDVTEGGK